MKAELWKSFKYFKSEEFNSPDHERSGMLMDYEFVKILDEVREQFQKPISINSGYRTPEYNLDLIKRGYQASPNSSHMKGVAADIHCTSANERWRLISFFLAHGIKRIGVASKFLHVDIDRQKVPAIWHYNH